MVAGGDDRLVGQGVAARAQERRLERDLQLALRHARLDQADELREARPCRLLRDPHALQLDVVLRPPHADQLVPQLLVGAVAAAPSRRTGRPPSQSSSSSQRPRALRHALAVALEPRPQQLLGGDRHARTRPSPRRGRTRARRRAARGRSGTGTRSARGTGTCGRRGRAPGSPSPASTSTTASPTSHASAAAARRRSSCSAMSERRTAAARLPRVRRALLALTAAAIAAILPPPPRRRPTRGSRRTGRSTSRIRAARTSSRRTRCSRSGTR